MTSGLPRRRKVKPDFPWLDENMSIQFPPAEEATEEGLLASGGNLSPGMLLCSSSLARQDLGLADVTALLYHRFGVPAPEGTDGRSPAAEV